MIIYNVTVSVLESISDEWLDWMKNVHIPEVMATGLFTSNKILKLLLPETDEGVTYAIQYSMKSMDEYDKYQKEYAPAMQKLHTDRYEGRVHAFRTVLETLD